VDNRDTQTRIHLVLDCRPGAWLEQAIIDGLATTPSPQIGDQALEQFKALLASDPQLCKTLQGLPDNEAFIDRTLALAAERGLVFTREELRAAMRDGRRQWTEQWSA
jgi:hypothetical protein